MDNKIPLAPLEDNKTCP